MTDRLALALSKLGLKPKDRAIFPATKLQRNFHRLNRLL